MIWDMDYAAYHPVDWHRDDGQSMVTATVYSRRGREYTVTLTIRDRADARLAYRAVRLWLHGHKVSVNGVAIPRLPGSLVWRAAS